jgi:FkbM family methyltransferase
MRSAWNPTHLKKPGPVFLKRVINRMLGLAGLRLVKNIPALGEADLGLQQILKLLEIDVVFDVGASFGQYGERLRKIGYLGHIVSFEPQLAAFSVLREKTLKDANWDAVPIALGDQEITQNLNVSQNSMSSSFLFTAPDILCIEPTIARVRTESVSVRRLDQIYRSLDGSGANFFLKLDVQGYEPNVLTGAREFLLTCRAVQMEIALLPSYQCQLLFQDMVELMLQKRFLLVHLERGLWDPCSGFLIEVDGIFVRQDDVERYFAMRTEYSSAQM